MFNFGIGGLSQSPKKRTLGIRDKQILYHRAKGKCEACGNIVEVLTGGADKSPQGGQEGSQSRKNQHECGGPVNLAS